MSSLTPIALITGAASGLGAACARDLARRATGGLILVDTDEDGLSATADALPHAPERVSTLTFDVADAERWKQAAAFVSDQYGRIDWAILNAAPALCEPAASDDWRHGASSNLDAIFLSLRSLMPLMRMNVEGGAIVIIGSGLHSADGAEPAKADLPKLTRVAAKEGAGDQIRVNTIAPGGPETELWRGVPNFAALVAECGSERAALDRIAALAMPLVRYGQAELAPRLITQLLTESSPISGATLVVEGGYTL